MTNPAYENLMIAERAKIARLRALRLAKEDAGKRAAEAGKDSTDGNA